MSLLENIFTSKNKTAVKTIVKETAQLANSLSKITHSQEKIKIRLKPSNELKIMTKEEFEFFKLTESFKRRLREGQTIENIMPEAFAVCREATKRRLGMTHYDVQIEAAAAMQNNAIVEMKTGEGKSLVQILSAYLNALEATCSLNPEEHSSVHVITANEYLAQRDWEDNSKVFSLLGLSSGYAMSQAKVAKNEELIQRKKEAYKCDIVFATAPTIAFDYLEDNHALKDSNRFLRKKLHKAIVDEADDILLDQATKPLILSSGSEEKDINKEDVYTWAVKFINGEKGYRKRPIRCRIFNQYDKNKYDPYTEDCALYLDNMIVDMEKISREIYGENPNLSDPDKAEELFQKEQTVMKCLLAREYFKEGKQYQVFEDENLSKEDGKHKIMKVVLTDSFTGRSLEKTRYQNGYQEAIEATVDYNLSKLNQTSQTKYKLNFSKRNKQIAKCTYPDFLSIYEKGVCGMTGTSDEDEFMDIYGLETYKLETRKPNIRIDEPDELYATEEAKFKAIIRDILNCQKTLQPVLIGTTNVEESNRLCKYLEKYGIRHQRLDEVNKENETGIKETAGLLGSVTVATNMAGRGIDIKLGPGAEEAGGLYVICTSKNKNRRIDNQLRGRASRQGQPGKTKYFMSLDDELVRLRYGTNKFDAIKKLYANTSERITDKLVLSMVNNCQLTEESKTKQHRKQTEEIEAKVFTKHKKLIYDQRMKILTSNEDELLKTINNMLSSYVNSLFERNFSEEEIEAKLSHLIDVKECYSENKNEYKNNLLTKLKTQLNFASNFQKDKYIIATRRKMLKVIDDYWIGHIETLNTIWQNATYYAYSNVDPVEIYINQSIKDLQMMTYYIQNEMITYALNPGIKYGQYEIKTAKNSIEEEVKMTC